MKILRNIVFLALPLFLVSEMEAQNTTFKLDDPQNASVIVEGTSTLHKWTAEASKFGASPTEIDLSTPIDSFRFFVEVTSFKSGRSSTMDKKIYKAFNAEENPLVEYIQKKPVQIGTIGADGAFSFKSQGTLAMAGVSKDVEIEVQGEKTPEGVTMKIAHPIKMSTYEMERPSAMFGQIVTGDEVTVNIELKWVGK